MNHFFITGYPRSKTAWLANYLTWGRSVCFHDVFAKLQSVAELETLFSTTDADCVGNSDPANLIFFEKLIAMYPQAAWVVVMRDEEEVSGAMMNAFRMNQELVPGTLAYYRTRIGKLLSMRFDALVVPFSEVQDRCTHIARHCIPDWQCPAERREMLANFHVQLESEYLDRKIAESTDHPILKEMEAA